MSTAEIAVEPRIGLDSAGLLMTPEEFDAIEEGDYDDLYRYQLIHGVLVVNPITSEAESSPNDYLGYVFNDFRFHHPQGRVLDATLPERYIRTRNGRRRADRVIWAGLGRRPNPKIDTPTIAVEFVSFGRRSWERDYEFKRDEYMEAGVVEYWIIERFARTLTVFRNTGDGVQKLVIHEDETYRTDLLPGFELPLGDLFFRADEWEE